MGEERKAELDKLSEIVAKKVNYNQRIIDETEKLKNQEQTPEVLLHNKPNSFICRTRRTWRSCKEWWR